MAETSTAPTHGPEEKAPKLSEEEIDDLIYFARAGEETDLAQTLKELADREGVSVTRILETASDEGKATCLHMAAANGHGKAATQILSYLPAPPSASTRASSASTSQEAPSAINTTPTSYINAPNSFGNTALHWACLGGHLDIVKLLLSRGASPAAVNDKDQIPLDLAAFNNHMHIVEYFLSQTKDIESRNAAEGGLTNAVGDSAMEDVEDEAEGSSAT